MESDPWTFGLQSILVVLRSRYKIANESNAAGLAANALLLVASFVSLVPYKINNAAARTEAAFGSTGHYA